MQTKKSKEKNNTRLYRFEHFTPRIQKRFLSIFS